MEDFERNVGVVCGVTAGLSSGIIVLALKHHEILGLLVPVAGSLALLVVVQRMPLRCMNLPVSVNASNEVAVREIVRLHLAGIVAVAMGLFWWLAFAIAFAQMTAYLATWWLFIVAIGWLTLGMIARLKRLP